MALLRAEAKTMAQALAFLRQAREAFDGPAAVRIYDAVPMRMQRLMNLERAQMLLESSHRPMLQEVLRSWLAALRRIKIPRDLRWHLDVDPLEF